MIEPMTTRARLVTPPDVDAPTREARRLSTLLEVSQALSGTLNLKASLHRVLEVLARHHGAVHTFLQRIERAYPAIGAVQRYAAGIADLRFEQYDTQNAARHGGWGFHSLSLRRQATASAGRSRSGRAARPRLVGE